MLATARRIIAAVAITAYAGAFCSAAAYSSVPGSVIDHLPAGGGVYVGSPALAVLPDGTYIASHDLFGPSSTAPSVGVTKLFRSIDRGVTWSPLSTISGQQWSNLFTQGNALYLMGTSKDYGRVTIRKSIDGGATWTTPSDTTNGYLSLGETHHTAPTPVVIADGRIWRSMEDTGAGGGWPAQFRTFVMSAPIGSDLLNKGNWRYTGDMPGTAKLSSSKGWLPNNAFNGWLEGNMVRTAGGELVNVLRVDVPAGAAQKGAIVHVNPADNGLAFDPAVDIVNLPGGSSKFTIRYDPATQKYWTLSDTVTVANNVAGVPPGSIRDVVSLVSSTDLTNWTITRTVLSDTTDAGHIGFQYLDWQFDGADIVAVSRTAYPDGVGGANSYHNANYLTFHRIVDYAAVPEPATIAPLLGMLWLSQMRWKLQRRAGRIA
ncbi:MAG: sialidase family protein [Tepidisphaeraceae bacterium]